MLKDRDTLNQVVAEKYKDGDLKGKWIFCSKPMTDDKFTESDDVIRML